MLLLFIWQQLDMLQSQPVFPLDDSYITLQNAQELLGSASAFGQPGALAGATSLIHTLLTALLLAIVGNGLVALSCSLKRKHRVTFHYSMFPGGEKKF